MIESVLLCNAGSASLKVEQGELSASTRELVDFAGSHSDILSGFEAWLNARPESAVVLHRIVHAGAVTESPCKLDEELIARIHHWHSLAPLHNGLALDLIAMVGMRWPVSEQFAIFDSGLFSDLPAVSKYYPLPSELSPRWPIQRYGFHGLAHRSQMRTLQGLGSFERVITLQLGGGTSAAAWRNNQVIDTTMGFTPLDGLPMGHRSGGIDPGILLHLLENESADAKTLRQLLNENSGLQALSGGISDMRELLASKTESARFAVDYYCYQLRKQIGSYIAILGGLDAISIGGGIGEHQSVIRSRIFEGLSHLSLSLCELSNANAKGVTALHEPGMTPEIWLTPIDEAAEMLQQFTHFRRLHRL